jgi:RNA recognition motif-containing protein
MDTSFRTIYVENFPLNTPERLLQKLFANFGTVKHVDLPTFEPEHPLCRGLPKPKAKGYAFIEFTKKDAADKSCRFFNDLEYIKTVARIIKSGDTTQQPVNDSLLEDPTLYRSIVQNLEFRKLLLLRVMPKKKFQDLSRTYNEKKLNSLIGAARLLMVA